MKALSSSTLKNVVSGSIVATLLAVTTGCVTTPGGYSVYDDMNRPDFIGDLFT
ncbi:hypothetical protein [Psychrobacter pacificensis]|uniref:hypothetical protein n=1 Tax=Psychrobacter pacificensis TaxID=112002 RepID=UPI001CBF5D55|nr:hypothetical protein [Psychrobacter pacificensis]MBZ1393148.1 hypothetical protein [Psychrobacter pacificensis]